MDDPIISAIEERLEVEPVADPEDLRVQLWRLDQFLGLGFAPAAAAALADSDADTARARWIIAHGCAQELAVRILL